jgi:hypothetical protein
LRAHARLRSGVLKEARVLEGKAADIDNPLFDLKAVNPNRTDDSDDRTPGELLDFIARQGQEIATVLAEQRARARAAVPPVETAA